MATKTFTTRENYLNILAATHNNELLPVMEVISEVNPIVFDAPTIEATDMVSHRGSRRTSLPQPVWTKIGNGWTTGFARQQPFTEGIGTLKLREQINKDLLRIQPNPEGYVSQQERAFQEGFAQETANTIFYGSSITAPEEFDGLHVRYGAVAANSVYNNGETAGSVTSAWLVQWKEGECGLLRPRFDPAVGLTREPMPDQLLDGDDSNKAWFKVVEWAWNIGLLIGDTRRVKRICNINPSWSDAQCLDSRVLIEAQNDFTDKATPIIMYCNTAVATQLDIDASLKGNVIWSSDNVWGVPIRMFRGMPVRVCDAITETESVLS